MGNKKKIHQIKTTAPMEKTIREIRRVMTNLGFEQNQYRIVPDPHTEKAGLLIIKDDIHYAIVSEKQRDLKNNMRAVYHLIHSRELNIRKGVETIETAFGGYVDWLTTPKLPEKVEQALFERGVQELPPPKKRGAGQLEIQEVEAY